jgi:hypothetical protein
VLVELALVLPVFLLIAAGVVEFGQALRVGRMLTDEARQAARQTAENQAAPAVIEQDVGQLLTQTLHVSPGDVDVAIVVEPAPLQSHSGGRLGASLARELIDVRIRVGYDKVACVAGGFLEGINLEGHCRLLHD